MNYLVSTAIGAVKGRMGFLTGTPDTEGVADFLKGEGNGMFDGITETAKGTFASAYGLVTIIAMGVAVIALIIAAVLMSAQKKASDASENKGWIVRILIAVVIVAGATSLVSLFFGIGEGL